LPITVLYVEAMFQVWWRSVYKWRLDLGDRRRTLETGDRRLETGRAKW